MVCLFIFINFLSKHIALARCRAVCRRLLESSSFDMMCPDLPSTEEETKAQRGYRTIPRGPPEGELSLWVSGAPSLQDILPAPLSLSATFD